MRVAWCGCRALCTAHSSIITWPTRPPTSSMRQCARAAVLDARTNRTASAATAAVYVDCEGGFSVERFVQMVEEDVARTSVFGGTATNALDMVLARVDYFRVHDHWELLAMIRQWSGDEAIDDTVEGSATNSGAHPAGTTRLFIVDGISAAMHRLADVPFERSRVLARLALDLGRMAHERQLGVYR